MLFNLKLSCLFKVKNNSIKGKNLLLCYRPVMSQNIPTLGGKWFKQRDKLTAPHVRALVVPGTGPAAVRKLEEMNWNGKVVGTILMELSNDNRNVESARFELHGSISDAPITVPAKKIWEDADESTSVAFKLPPGGKFKFPNGLTSDYVDESELEPAVVFRNNQADNPIIGPEEREPLGIGSFCLRLVAQPASVSFIKITILVYPEDKEELLSHPLAMNPSWPGIRLFDGQLPLFPPSSVKSLQWGQPFLPLFILGSPWETASNIPQQEEIVAKFAAIMRSGAMPDTCRNAQVLATRWEDIDEAGASRLSKTRVEKLWPAPPATPTLQGLPGSPSFFFLCAVFRFGWFSFLLVQN